MSEETIWVSFLAAVILVPIGGAVLHGISKKLQDVRRGRAWRKEERVWRVEYARTALAHLRIPCSKENVKEVADSGIFTAIMGGNVCGPQKEVLQDTVRELRDVELEYKDYRDLAILIERAEILKDTVRELREVFPRCLTYFNLGLLCEIADLPSRRERISRVESSDLNAILRLEGLLPRQKLEDIFRSGIRMSLSGRRFRVNYQPEKSHSEPCGECGAESSCWGNCPRPKSVIDKSEVIELLEVAVHQ
ncbi:MAG: hypothetical protein JO264_10255 [Acidisphaera sp.]|nr:hypothetical protein [Acidisphaera sp.]